MADRSAIEWTDATWTPVKGCTRASEGCRNCYAEIMAARFSDPGQWGEGLATIVTTPQGKDHRWTGAVRFDAPELLKPLAWRKPRRIFVCSTSDLFHESVPDEWIDQVFAVMALCPQHTFQVLTKRADRMRAYFAADQLRWRIDGDMDAIIADRVDPLDRRSNDLRALAPDLDETWPLPNVWLGVSVEDQQHADQRIPDLLATPAAIRWLSCEPLLGPVDLHRYLLGFEGFPLGGSPGVCACGHGHGFTRCPNYGGVSASCPRPHCDCTGFQRARGVGLHWVVAGGESGHGARPIHPRWYRALRDQCAVAGVPFFGKQWGEWGPDTGPLDDAPPYRDPVMEGAQCAVLVDGDWQHFPSAYAAPIELCSGHGEFVYRLGKKRNGRLLDGVEHNGMPA